MEYPSLKMQGKDKSSVLPFALYASFSCLHVLFDATVAISYLAAIAWMSLSNFIDSILLILHSFKHLLMRKILKQNRPSFILRVTHQ